VYKPVGVEDSVLIVRVLENDGSPDAGLKEQDAPKGREEEMQDNATDCAIPPVRVAVIVLEPELPGWTLISPEFDSE